LHSQGGHHFPAEVLLNTNEGGQLLAFVILLDSDTAATICIGGRGAV